MVGWFWRTVGCKPPRGEQMLMTCCYLVGFHAALSTPAPKLLTPVKRSPWGGIKPFLHLPSAMVHPRAQLRGLSATWARAEQLWGCSVLHQSNIVVIIIGTVQHSWGIFLARCLQDVFVLTSLMCENTHKTRCSAQPICHSLNSSLYFHLTCSQNKIFLCVISYVCNTAVIIE